MPRKLFTRQEWGAEPPKAQDPEEEMVTRGIFTYRTNTLTCSNKYDCFKVLQKMQRSHFKRGMSDIAYNFLVGGDGNIYEGRGWGVKPSKSLYWDPGARLDIAFIGNHMRETIPVNMFKTAFEVLQIGQRLKFVSKQCDLEEIIKPVKEKQKKRGKGTLKKRKR